MTAATPRVLLSDGVLVVSGEVTIDTVVGVRRQGEKLISSVTSSLVVDLGGLVTAHSVVLSMLLCWQRLARRAGISLSFRGVSGPLASLAALSTLDEQFAGFGPEFPHSLR
ncbi:STAS domain-containing protein [Marinobacter sp. F3R08]|uniref:STAS domain-containing protein n=1 Tax=Marinobacter sp. F3R08 TaxID=2841559 RepID=UPI001C0A28A5|nr:STAS domain-containing protein [Marinobacter sp. F3R08]MBU2954508.1 STAS domain-containing protein [Marinobacter sp. F3R08]